MQYLARCAVTLKNDIENFPKNTWHNLSKDSNYKIRLRDDLCLEVTSDCFNDKIKALGCAKNMYVSLIYYLLKCGYTIASETCCC